MNNRNRLQELKVKASLLKKQLLSDDKDVQTKAAERFLQLPFHKYNSVEYLLQDVGFYQLKHAYWVLAIENGHDSWQAFKESVIKEDCMYYGSCGAYLNVWFANYDEAKQYHRENSGYLLPYRKDYYVCTEEVIQFLGLDEHKQEWQKLGNNWVEATCLTSWNTIYGTAKKNYQNYLKVTSKPTKRTDNRPEWLKQNT